MLPVANCALAVVANNPVATNSAKDIFLYMFVIVWFFIYFVIKVDKKTTLNTGFYFLTNESIKHI